MAEEELRVDLSKIPKEYIAVILITAAGVVFLSFLRGVVLGSLILAGVEYYKYYKRKKEKDLKELMD